MGGDETQIFMTRNLLANFLAVKLVLPHANFFVPFAYSEHTATQWSTFLYVMYKEVQSYRKVGTAHGHKHFVQLRYKLG